MDFATLKDLLENDAPKAELVEEDEVVYYRKTSKSTWYQYDTAQELADELGYEQVDDVEEVAAPKKIDRDRHPASDDEAIGKAFVTLNEQGRQLKNNLDTAESGRRNASLTLRHAIKGRDEALAAEGLPLLVGPSVMSQIDGALIAAARSDPVVGALAEQLASASALVAKASGALMAAYEGIKRVSSEAAAALE